MGWMPTDSKTRFAMGLPTMEESESSSKRDSEETSAKTRLNDALARRAYAEAEEQKRQSLGYNQGGAVYKHAHPTYTKFGQTADSSLLAKGRK